VRPEEPMGLLDGFKISNFSVSIDNPIVLAGTNVTGKVSFSVASNVTIKAIRIRLTGRETVTIGQCTQERKKFEEMSDPSMKSNFLQCLLTVAGSCKYTGTPREHVLRAGDYVIPFQFWIPFGLPASADSIRGDGYYGSIFYMVKAYIDIPRGRDVSHVQLFTVHSVMPIPQFYAREPVSINMPNIPVQFCCFSKGFVAAQVYLDKNAIPSGGEEPLNVTVDIDNTHSKEAVNAVRVRLLRQVEIQYMENQWGKGTFLASEKSTVQVVSPGSRGRVVVSLQPTAMCPSQAGLLIDVGYQVEVELDIPWASDQIVTRPIVLTPVPVQYDAPTFLPNVKPGKVPKRAVHCEFKYQVPPCAPDAARGLELLPPVQGLARGLFPEQPETVNAFSV